MQIAKNLARTFAVIRKLKLLSRTLLEIPRSFHHQAKAIERQMLLSGRQACFQLSQRPRLSKLADAEFRVSSQWGEDGIVEWLIQNITVSSATFVEFGVENFMECNTRFLLQNRNWRGLVMDGSQSHMDYVRATELYWRYDLTALKAFITRENINSLLTGQGFDGEIGILSIDIDGNDYWIFDAIESCRPQIVIIEYNPIFGDLHSIVVPYDETFNRFEAHYSGLYFGASIKAINDLVEKRGYAAVGTCSNGINAFYVRDDIAPQVLGKLDDVVQYPSRHRDSRNLAGDLSFVAGAERAELIRDQSVLHLDSGEIVKIGDLGPLYSRRWLDDM